MTDRELLELAAKAAGLADLSDYDKDMQRFLKRWNPLDDDYDAFRLAVLLKIDVCIGDGYTDAIIKHIESGVERSKTGFTEPHASDAVAATRRAIVRSAAYIGEWKQ